MRPVKWKCANECQLLTIGEIKIVVGKGRSRGSSR